MEKIVRNYLEIKSLDELLEKKKPNNKYIVEKVKVPIFGRCMVTFGELIEAPRKYFHF